MQVNGNNISEKNKPLTSTTKKERNQELKHGHDVTLSLLQLLLQRNNSASSEQDNNVPYVTRKLVVGILLLFSDDETFSDSEKLCSLFRVFLENKENKPELL